MAPARKTWESKTTAITRTAAIDHWSDQSCQDVEGRKKATQRTIRAIAPTAAASGKSFTSPGNGNAGNQQQGKGEIAVALDVAHPETHRREHEPDHDQKRQKDGQVGLGLPAFPDQTALALLRTTPPLMFIALPCLVCVG